MPRGRSLRNCVQDVRSELSDSHNVNVGKSFDKTIKTKLTRVQRELHEQHDWPFLTKSFSKDLAAGSRYYDIPDQLSETTISDVRHKHGGIWSEPLAFGIDTDEYNVHDSEAGVRVDPVQSWDYYDNDGTTQVEVWPIPKTDQTGALRFKGKIALKPFADENDVCTLESNVIVLHVVAEILDARDRKDAAQVFGKAANAIADARGSSKPTGKLNLNGPSRNGGRRLSRISVS